MAGWLPKEKNPGTICELPGVFVRPEMQIKKDKSVQNVSWMHCINIPLCSRTNIISRAMKIPRKIWAFVFVIALVHIHSASSQCLPDQKSLLLELRNSLEFNDELSTKLVGWNESKDCCHWRGVQCDKSNGQVNGLDLSDEAITSQIDNPSSLFRLQYLKRLNLAYNPFGGTIPSALGKLTSLTYLNLSHTVFIGQVPFQISQLEYLVVLDFSMSKDEDEDPFAFSSLQIRNGDLAVIMENLTRLRELYLGGIVLSGDGIKWGKAVSSLVQLQVLSIYYSGDFSTRFHGRFMMDVTNETKSGEPNPSDGSHMNSKKKVEWKISGAVGILLGIIFFFGPLICIKSLREWYNYHADRVVMKMLPNEDSRKRNKTSKAKQDIEAHNT